MMWPSETVLYIWWGFVSLYWCVSMAFWGHEDDVREASTYNTRGDRLVNRKVRYDYKLLMLFVFLMASIGFTALFLGMCNSTEAKTIALILVTFISYVFRKKEINNYVKQNLDVILYATPVLLTLTLFFL